MLDRVLMFMTGDGQQVPSITPERIEFQEIPAGNGLSVAFSFDENYLGVGHATSPYFSVYANNNGVFSKLPPPSSLPSSTTQGIALTNDGGYIACAHVSSPYISIYKRNGSTITKLANPSTPPTGFSRSACFSPNANILVIGHETAPFISIYRRVGDVFTKIPNPDSIPNSGIYTTKFTNDGQYLICGGASTNLLVYEVSGEVFTLMPEPAPSDSGLIYNLDVSDVGDLVTIKNTAKAESYVSEMDGVYSRSQLIPIPSTSTKGAVGLTVDGNNLFIGSGASPYLRVFEKDSLGEFVLGNQPAELPTGIVNQISVSNSGKYTAVAQTGTPYIMMYENF